MFISHFMCVQILHITNGDMPAGVGAPPLNIELPFQRLIFSSGRSLAPGIFCESNLGEARFGIMYFPTVLLQ